MLKHRATLAAVTGFVLGVIVGCGRSSSPSLTFPAATNADLIKSQFKAGMPSVIAEEAPSGARMSRVSHLSAAAASPRATSHHETNSVASVPAAGGRDSLVNASRTGRRIEWALSAPLADEDIDHFEVLLSKGDRGVTELKKLPADARFYEMASAPSDTSSKIFIKAVEKSGRMSHLSNVVSLGRDIEISGLADGALVNSPIHVVASATSDQPVTEVQVSLDGLLVSSQQFDHIDASILAEPGSHHITVTGWDLAGNQFKRVVSVKVRRPGMDMSSMDGEEKRGALSVSIDKPSDNTEVVSTSARLVVSASGNQPITKITVYRDDDKVLTRKASHLDTSVPLEVGSHRIMVRAEDRAGHTSEAYVYVERLPKSMALGDNLSSSEKVR